MAAFESMDIKEFKKLQANLNKKTKYKSVKTVVDGITFDSKAEAAYYSYLRVLEGLKEVEYFLMQVPFLLEAGVKYRLDFLVFYSDGHVDHIDVKGVATPEFKMKKKMVEVRYPIKIRCLKQVGKRFDEVSV